MMHFRSRSNCEQEARFIQDHLIASERSISELTTAFSQYSKKLSKLRDESDYLARMITKYSENELINKSLSSGLDSLSAGMETLGDYGNARVQSIDNQVVCEFSKYSNICKQVKEDIKQIYNVKDKELTKKRQLNRLQERNSKNRQQIIQAETEFIRASAEVTKTVQNLEEKTLQFEKQKLHDMKEIFLDFVTIEIGYHAKAIQVLTKTFGYLKNIDVDGDFQDFKNNLNLSENTTTSGSVDNKYSMFKTSSLGSLGTIFSTTHQRHTSGIPGIKERAQSEDNLDSFKTSTSDIEETQSEQNISESLSESTNEYCMNMKKSIE